MDKAGQINMEEIKNTKAKGNGKIIYVHSELIEVLEALNKQIKRYGWDALEVSWIDLTKVLARKVKAAKLV